MKHTTIKKKIKAAACAIPYGLFIALVAKYTVDHIAPLILYLVLGLGVAVTVYILLKDED